MDNSPGKIVEMERNAVDDNRDRTCSAGLHFCSQSYLTHFGGEKIVIVKINPKDVVSIPSDYNDAKGRACRYEVVGEMTVDSSKAFTHSVQDMCNSDDFVNSDGAECDDPINAILQSDGFSNSTPAFTPKRDSRGRFV
jgi:hypothetical protein